MDGKDDLELLGEVNESDEFVDEQAEMMEKKYGAKKNKHKLIPQERFNFDSAEFYKQKELDKQADGDLTVEDKQLREAHFSKQGKFGVAKTGASEH